MALELVPAAMAFGQDGTLLRIPQRDWWTEQVPCRHSEPASERQSVAQRRQDAQVSATQAATIARLISAAGISTFQPMAMRRS